MAAKVISTVADSVTIPESGDLPITHFIIGKAWDWGDTGDYTFVADLDEIEAQLKDAERIYVK